MHAAILPLDKPTLRNLDINSLWRILDEVKRPVVTDSTALERTRADKVRERVTSELRNRGVRI